MPLDDLLPKAGDINKVTENIQQPPSGTPVTETSDKSQAATTLNTAQAKETAQVRAAVQSQEVDADYKFEIDHAGHKVTIVPEQGLTYNYKATCTCAWTGRFMTSDLAELEAKKHINSKIPKK